MTSPEWRKEAIRLAGRIEAAGYRRGLDRKAPSDHEPEIAALLAHLDATPAAQRWPAGLLDRIKAAEQRVQDNRAPRSIPADPHSDVDLVLAEVRYLIEGTWPPFWIKDTPQAVQPAVDALPSLSDEREVLAELVEVQDTYKRLHQLHEMGQGTDYDATRKRERAAWERARALLAQHPVHTSGVEVTGKCCCGATVGICNCPVHAARAADGVPASDGKPTDTTAAHAPNENESAAPSERELLERALQALEDEETGRPWHSRSVQPADVIAAIRAHLGDSK